MSEVPPVQKPATTPPPVMAPAAPPPPQPGDRRWLILGILALIVLLTIAAYFLVPDLYEKQTDDAYIDAHLVSVIPKVPAYVQTLHVNDNSKVTAGDLLVELDPRDYAVQVDVARANVAAAVGKLEEARNQVAVADANIGQQQAELDVSKANAKLAVVNLARLQSVADVRAVSSERVDEAKAAADGTRASVTAAQVKVDALQAQAKLTRSQVKTAEAAVAQAHAMLEQATLNLSYTKIYATESGSVANKSVEQGNFVQPGQTLLSVVPDKLYVIANYKETQLTHVRPGQQVTVLVDAFPDLRLRGHVDSIQRGTGSHFALLPPENATGNFVKVVQRVPVKIELDNPGEALKLISPGMSVETEIFVRERPAWLGFRN
ncbi:HlyD family secretion protein [Paraburkholderia elongata]|uniref:HlyD family efflux transporter periplasmic adaptor subunit n=1 Tax=Paraburkholderia elongata TaxID=2675747 RepID=A0A972SLB3_9BURK|nr:HlyD family secretion protein [Paraburkholderia elongata]NPT59923.1 HlyD family efflux transporter periplasmic adaptor subunit [Paraburkholderia elongata]